VRDISRPSFSKNASSIMHSVVSIENLDTLRLQGPMGMCLLHWYKTKATGNLLNDEISSVKNVHGRAVNPIVNLVKQPCIATS
jgi:hypothetical protein